MSEEEIRALVQAADFVDACDSAFCRYGRGEVTNPPRSETVSADGGYFRLEMPAQWPGHFRSVKVIEEHSDIKTGRLGQRQAHILLEDLRTGQGVRLEADYITDMRTGAAGALGIKYLASGSVHRCGLVGTGRIAACLALALDSLFDLEEIQVTSRKPESRAAFARNIGPRLKSRLDLVDSVPACAAGVDALVLAVPTPVPILSAANLAPGMVLSVMGGDGRTRQLAPEVLEVAQVVVDHPQQAERSGEFAFALEEGRYGQIGFVRDSAGKVLHIGDAACGQLPEGDGSPRLAYFTGLAIQDLCAGIAVYQKLRRR